MKILNNRIAVLENDTHISRWVEETGELNHDKSIRPLREYIPSNNGIVIDVGAFIGDHTIFYLDCVGKYGLVVAIEPNPDAYACLIHNCPTALCINTCVGKEKGFATLEMQDNVGASYAKISKDGISMHTLDSLMTTCDFLKIDAEGFEPDVLVGAKNLLKSARPVLFVEVNRGALERNGFQVDDILKRIPKNYDIRIWQPECKWEDLQFDILCTPK